jgi:hypothetical protein
MSKKKDHLADWIENLHKTKPAAAPCIWRHVGKYTDTKFKRCNYRHIAHDYSKENERSIYNVPCMRAPARWVAVWVDGLKPSIVKRGKRKGQPIAGTQPKSPIRYNSQGEPEGNGAWNLGEAPNFEDWKKPYWHNTHHVIACGEVKASFPLEKEQRRLLASDWNINEMDNVIILPKQFAVAHALKLPTHVPPDGKQEHDNYSKQLADQLSGMRGDLDNNGAETGHPTTEETVGGVKTQLNNIAKGLRKFLISCGEKNPGVNLDNLNLKLFDWPGR